MEVAPVNSVSAADKYHLSLGTPALGLSHSSEVVQSNLVETCVLFRC